MISLLENISLKPFNTFGIDASARYFVEIHSDADLQELIADGFLKNRLHLILGGGSNVLFTSDFQGIVLKTVQKGIAILEETAEYVWVEAAAGEVWQDFVLWAVERNYGGIENLSLIPGCVGASPIQNIGAYGVEAKDTIRRVNALELRTGKKHVFENRECRFGYRDSIFKKELKGELMIDSVVFELSKNPVINTDYGAIRNELEKKGIKNPSIKDISELICEIRTAKLPDPAAIGNAGSFFKNPLVNAQKVDELKQTYPNLVTYPQPDGTVKLAAGWLIEQCNWKGYKNNQVGVHPKQALILVNYQNASGLEVISLAGEIQQSVREKFAIDLEMEVNVY